MNKVDKFFEWMLKNKLKAALSFMFVAVALVVGFLALQFIVLPILGISLLIWILADCPVPARKQAAEPIPNIGDFCGVVTGWVHHNTTSLCQQGVLTAPIRAPIGRNEITRYPPIVDFGGISSLQFYIPLAMDKLEMELDLEVTKAVWQAGMDNLLAEGILPDQPHMAALDGTPIPITGFGGLSLLHVAEIRREHMRLVVTAYWVNSAMVAFRAKLSQKKPQKARGSNVDITDKDY